VGALVGVLVGRFRLSAFSFASLCVLSLSHSLACLPRSDRRLFIRGIVDVFLSSKPAGRQTEASPYCFNLDQAHHALLRTS
jgi:hypothetical protein